MKRRFIYIILIVVGSFAGVGWCVARPVKMEAADIAVIHGDKSYKVKAEIADDMRERAAGLMNRRELPDGTGMLFLFGDEEPVSMWMKNTYIPLDMLFIDRFGVIVNIAENTTPLSEEHINSGKPAYAVLELPAGSIKKWDVTTGDKVEHPAFE